MAGAQGDANLRSFMNWGALASDSAHQVLEHWRKLGEFRLDHPAVGAGEDHTLLAKPFIFSRILVTDNVDDRVVVGLGLPKGPKAVPLAGVFPNGAHLTDAYSGAAVTVRQGAVSLDTPFDLVLLSEPPRPENDTVVVIVTDNYALPMEIYASAAGTTYRLGLVDPGIERRFVLQPDLLATNQQVTFVAQASGVGPRVEAEPIYVAPGDVIDFILETNLIGSRAVVRLRR